MFGGREAALLDQIDSLKADIRELKSRRTALDMAIRAGTPGEHAYATMSRAVYYQGFIACGAVHPPPPPRND